MDSFSSYRWFGYSELSKEGKECSSPVLSTQNSLESHQLYLSPLPIANEKDLLTPSVFQRQKSSDASEEERANTDAELSTVVSPVATTLSQCLMRVLPDADVASPNVIVIGAQNVGKTSQIRKMVFYHLIHNEYFTDDMGTKLLQLIRVGGGLVTRRPVTISLGKRDINECRIKLKLGGLVAEYCSSSESSSPLPRGEGSASDERKFNSNMDFDSIINRITTESEDTAHDIFEEELVVEILAPNLPNVTFTDLPGLVTMDKKLSDSEKSIRELIVSYICRPNTTVVVVESASIDDFEISHVSPLLRYKYPSVTPLSIYLEILLCFFPSVSLTYYTTFHLWVLYLI